MQEIIAAKRSIGTADRQGWTSIRAQGTAALPLRTSQEKQHLNLAYPQEHAPIYLHRLTNLKDAYIHSCMVVTARRTDVERGGGCCPVRLDSEESLQVIPTSIKRCQFVELWEHNE